MTEVWPRPVPTVGDRTSAAQRAADPAAWALPPGERDSLLRLMAARRDIRRYRADAVSEAVIRRVLGAAHTAPSVGHSQPWRFVLVREPATRARAATMADRARLDQAARLDPESGRHLLDLDLEGIREAPVGIVVACDRRTDAVGVLGRATFPDADMWSCACAIENLWLAARAEGLGVGWVTLFEPAELADLVRLPEGVVPLGWLCVGWPDERPPTPGLERRGWSVRLPLEEVVFEEQWPDGGTPPPVGRQAPSAAAVPSQVSSVAARDSGDDLLSPPGSLGILDRTVDRLLAAHPSGLGRGGALVVAAADHPVAGLGVSAYPADVTRTVAEATVAGLSVGAVTAARSGLKVICVDAGVAGGPVAGAVDLRPTGATGDLVGSDALEATDVVRLLEGGRRLGARLAAEFDAVALGEVGVANTTVATAALAGALIGQTPERLVGLGAGSDWGILALKRRVVGDALARAADDVASGVPERLLGALGGGEIAVLTGVTLGAVAGGAIVVLDGLVTGCAALLAAALDPAVPSYLVAGQRSREAAHGPVLGRLGLEPLLDLRLRAGEGVGAALAWGLLRTAVAVRSSAARTSPAGSSPAGTPAAP